MTQSHYISNYTNLVNIGQLDAIIGRNYDNESARLQEN